MDIPNTAHTYNETQWPTAARRWHFALQDVSCRQSWLHYFFMSEAEWGVMGLSPVDELLGKLSHQVRSSFCLLLKINRKQKSIM